MKKLIISIVFFFICFSYVRAQTLPPIKVFKPEDYNADNQNWQISQSDSKFIYVANNRGLLEFDGSEWHLYESLNKSIIRSVKVIGDKVYTGCYMDFGYWSKNSFGKLEYVSLLPKLEQDIEEDDQIWNILDFNEWVVFQSSHNIYFYNTLNQTFKIIKTDKIIYNIFNIENTIFYSVRNEGIYKIKEGKPELVTEGYAIKNDKIISIFSINNEVIFLTQKSGFYKINNDKAIKWNIAASNIFEQFNVYCALRLKNGQFIIGTISNGIINLNSDGSFNYQINQKNGLSNNTALSLLEDTDNNLWVGLDNGINCINITSPVQVYNDFDGVLGTVYTSIVFKNILYVGTNQGLFFKNINTNDHFKFIEGTKGQVWTLFNYNDEDLLCGHHLGTFSIEYDKALLIDNNTLGSWSFKTIPNHKNLLLKGNYSGLYILERKDGKWFVRNKIEGFSSSSRFFELDKDNHIFVSHENKGVIKLTIDDSFKKVTKNEVEPSLEIGKNSSLVKYRGTILYSYSKGIFKYDQTDKIFKYDSLLSPIINKENYVSGKLVVDSKGMLWAFPRDNINYVLNDNLTNKPQIHSLAIPLNLRKVILSFENISQIKNNLYLLGTANGYLTINLAKTKDNNEYFIYLNSITFKDLDNVVKAYDKNRFIEFKPKKGIITFNYSTPNYDKYSEVKYQYKLEGFSNHWSDWSSTSKASFENLSFGNYILKVRSKVGNKLSQNIISYNFKVNRPILLSNLALSIYFITLILIVFITHKVYKRHYDKKLRQEQSESEKTIIEIKNQQLNDAIENKNRELTISKMSIIKKNELLNSIKKELKSHESPKNIRSVNKLIDDNLNNTKDWEFFVKAFNNTDKGFLEKVKKLHPNLTSNDIRFCVYLRLNLSSREIADLLNITVKSVETKRYRLRKRMRLPHQENLIDYILSL
ncbi:triple tyrosine motif-containing protein [Yeosuana marina]|uniref:triple tyrosine motif-containing protein n=1 Tax=Yeosuana marina TaxID=1565536 RepID=UPI0014229497|nr:triple tyrosine motif-containing protein [Yeosuana marina]